MRVYKSISDWRAARRDLGDLSLGFVPTMGAIHQGHLELVRRCRDESDFAVVSVFINPAQFDAADDLARYPVALERDMGLLESAGVDAVLLPEAAEIYADGFRYRVSESGLSSRYCGAHREGHFDGVLTVVMRLLNLVRPDRAYFGEKDFQQLQLVRGMVESFFMEVEIVACPIVREQDGLALSSRNHRLDTQARHQAPLLFRSISSAVSTEAARRQLESDGFEVEYVEDFSGRRLAAVRLGGVRLIDNIALETNHE